MGFFGAVVTLLVITAIAHAQRFQEYERKREWARGLFYDPDTRTSDFGDNKPEEEKRVDETLVSMGIAEPGLGDTFFDQAMRPLAIWSIVAIAPLGGLRFVENLVFVRIAFAVFVLALLVFHEFTATRAAWRHRLSKSDKTRSNVYFVIIAVVWIAAGVLDFVPGGTFDDGRPTNGCVEATMKKSGTDWPRPDRSSPRLEKKAPTNEVEQ